MAVEYVMGLLMLRIALTARSMANGDAASLVGSGYRQKPE
jgi:hypothetical protein